MKNERQIMIVMRIAERPIETQNQLILLTHSEKPWSGKREGLKPYVYSNNPISLDTMHDYDKARYDRNRAKKEA